jgi:hypothetical protein
MTAPTRLALCFFVGGFALSGCGHEIGDSCHVNTDCSAAGDRFCDTSAPGGYCTIEGCDLNNCPGGSVCIRFFTPVLSQPCECESDGRITQGSCQIGSRCVCDAPGSTDGHCAPESSERRWCQKSCSNDGDCRGQYQCRSTGTLGAESVPTLDMLSGEVEKFCAPRG